VENNPVIESKAPQDQKIPLEDRVLGYSSPYRKETTPILSFWITCIATGSAANLFKFVLEEDANGLLSIVNLANRRNIIIEGESRTGKSLILDRDKRLLDKVYEMEDAQTRHLQRMLNKSTCMM